MNALQFVDKNKVWIASIVLVAAGTAGLASGHLPVTIAVPMLTAGLAGLGVKGVGAARAKKDGKSR